MKVHMFNLLLLVIVGGCLFITLSGSAPEAKPVSSLHQAFVTVAPSPSPHPVDAYRQDRNRQRSENLQALEGLLSSADEQLQQTARRSLKTPFCSLSSSFLYGSMREVSFYVDR